MNVNIFLYVKATLNMYFSLELAKGKVLVEITIDKKVIYN